MVSPWCPFWEYLRVIDVEAHAAQCRMANINVTIFSTPYDPRRNITEAGIEIICPGSRVALFRT